MAATGLPNSAAGTTLLTVTVLDVNDNPPVFENPHPDTIILMEVSNRGSYHFGFVFRHLFALRE